MAKPVTNLVLYSVDAGGAARKALKSAPATQARNVTAMIFNAAMSAAYQDAQRRGVDISFRTIEETRESDTDNRVTLSASFQELDAGLDSVGESVDDLETLFKEKA